MLGSVVVCCSGSVVSFLWNINSFQRQPFWKNNLQKKPLCKTPNKQTVPTPTPPRLQNQKKMM